MKFTGIISVSIDIVLWQALDDDAVMQVQAGLGMMEMWQGEFGLHN